jgi:uncharacterized membrane protein YdbT with pleckstrin-like domain
MASKKVLEWIKKHKKEYGDEKLKKSLLQNGYSKEDIDSAFNLLKLINMFKVALIILIVFIFLLLIVVFFIMRNTMGSVY